MVSTMTNVLYCQQILTISIAIHANVDKVQACHPIFSPFDCYSLFNVFSMYFQLFQQRLTCCNVKKLKNEKMKKMKWMEDNQMVNTKVLIMPIGKHLNIWFWLTRGMMVSIKQIITGR